MRPKTLGQSSVAVLALVLEQVPKAVTVIGVEPGPPAVPAIQSGRARRRPTAERRDEAWLRRQLEGLAGGRA